MTLSGGIDIWHTHRVVLCTVKLAVVSFSRVLRRLVRALDTVMTEQSAQESFCRLLNNRSQLDGASGRRYTRLPQ